MTTAVPADTPITIPVTGSTVPTPIAPLLQEPPVVISESVVVAFEHICDVPVIADIAGFIVMTAVALQPVPIK